MTAEEMASRELKEWRQAELKHDIEKIKSHELEMISLGSVYVMKSHKGEQVTWNLRDKTLKISRQYFATFPAKTDNFPPKFCNFSRRNIHTDKPQLKRWL